MTFKDFSISAVEKGTQIGKEIGRIQREKERFGKQKFRGGWKLGISRKECKLKSFFGGARSVLFKILCPCFLSFVLMFVIFIHIG